MSEQKKMVLVQRIGPVGRQAPMVRAGCALVHESGERIFRDSTRGVRGTFCARMPGYYSGWEKEKER